MKVIKAQRLPMSDPDEWVVVGSHRWVLWHHPQASAVAFARFGRSIKGDWEIQELRFLPSDRRRPVQANDLRLLALGRLEAIARDPEVDVMLSAPDDENLPDATPEGSTASAVLARCAALPLRQESSALRIDVPPKGQRDLLFYATLDATYSRASRESRHPAKALAEANGVPVTTVHAWLKALKKFKAQLQADREAEAGRRAAAAKAFEEGLAEMGLTFDEYFEQHQEDDPLGYWADSTSEQGMI